MSNRPVQVDINVPEPKGDGFKKLAEQAGQAERAVKRTQGAIEQTGSALSRVGGSIAGQAFAGASGALIGQLSPAVGKAAGGGVLGGIASGALSGGMTGMMLGPKGAAIGAVAGGIAGGVGALFTPDDSYEKVAAVMNPIRQQQRTMRDLQEQLALRGRMGSNPNAALADASLQREQAVRRVLELEQQIGRLGNSEAAKRLDLTNQLADAHKHVVHSELRKLDAMKQQLDIIKQERARLDEMKGQFGLMDIAKQSAAVDVARKMKSGESLTSDELELARSVDLLRDPLQKYGQGQAQKSGLADFLVGFTGQDAKLREAEAAYAKAANIKVDVAQRVEAEIKIDESSLARHIEQQVTPAIQQAVRALNRQVVEQLTKLDLQRSQHTGNIPFN